MNAIPVTHACLGNHEFDHSIETLGQRLAELDCDVINTNVFACPLGEESVTKDAAGAALANARRSAPRDVAPATVRARRRSQRGRVPRPPPPHRHGHAGWRHRRTVGTVHHVHAALVREETAGRGVCGVRSAGATRRGGFSRTVDAVVALTHQTLPEDARLAEEVPEIAAILGGHEHTPFAGRMGHGANAAAAPLASKGVAAPRASACNEEAGTLCVKAGMDAENVVVVTIEVPGGPGSVEATLGHPDGHPREGRRVGSAREEAAASRAPQTRPPPPRRRQRAPRERITRSSVTED